MNGPILNFEVIFYAYQTEFQLNVSSPPHPGRPLSSDLVPALVITLRPQLRYLECTGYLLVDI